MCRPLKKRKKTKEYEREGVRVKKNRGERRSRVSLEGDEKARYMTRTIRVEHK